MANSSCTTSDTLRVTLVLLAAMKTVEIFTKYLYLPSTCYI